MARHPRRTTDGRAYTPCSWRYFWDFGNGVMPDMGIHHLDPAFNTLGLEAPVTVKATASEVDPKTIMASDFVTYQYDARGEQRAAHRVPERQRPAKDDPEGRGAPRRLAPGLQGRHGRVPQLRDKMAHRVAASAQVTCASPRATLVEGSRGSVGNQRSQRVGHAVVAAQLAMTLTLLTGAGLLGRSLLQRRGHCHGGRGRRRPSRPPGRARGGRAIPGLMRRAEERE